MQLALPFSDYFFLKAPRETVVVPILLMSPHSDLQSMGNKFLNLAVEV